MTTRSVKRTIPSATCVPNPILITEFIKEDSPLCLPRAITRTMIGLCYTLLSLAPIQGKRKGLEGDQAFDDNHARA